MQNVTQIVTALGFRITSPPIIIKLFKYLFNSKNRHSLDLAFVDVIGLSVQVLLTIQELIRMANSFPAMKSTAYSSFGAKLEGTAKLQSVVLVLSKDGKTQKVFYPQKRKVYDMSHFHIDHRAVIVRDVIGELSLGFKNTEQAMPMVGHNPAFNKLASMVLPKVIEKVADIYGLSPVILRQQVDASRTLRVDKPAKGQQKRDSHE